VEISTTKASESAAISMPRIVPSNGGASTFFCASASNAPLWTNTKTKSQRKQSRTSMDRIAIPCPLHPVFIWKYMLLD